MTLTHYIIVRRDLPFGVTCAQVAHAAGESFYILGRGSSEKEQSTFSRQAAGLSPAPGSTMGGRPSEDAGEASRLSGNGGSNPSRPAIPQSSKQDAPHTRGNAGSIPAWGANFEPHRTIAVVLGARNEQRLLSLERKLLASQVGHVAIREPDPPYNGQLMAIGLIPADREAVRPFVRDFQTIQSD